MAAGFRIEHPELLPVAFAFMFLIVLFPIAGLSRGLRFAMRLNPLTYGVDGLRGALAHGFVFGIGPDLAIMVFSSAILLCVGSCLLSKIQI